MRTGINTALVALVLLVPGHSSAREYADVRVEKLLFTTQAYNGQAVAYPKTAEPQVTVATVTFPPGGSTGWHEHPVPVYAYLLEGELSIELRDGTRHRFRKGDPIIEVTNLQHNGVNTGSGETRLVVFYTGAAGVPNVIKPPPAGAAGNTPP